MLNIIENYRAEQFINYAKGKNNVYAFGAGDFIKNFCMMTQRRDFEKSIFAFTDNNPEKWGQEIIIKDNTFPIISIDDFKAQIKQDDIILISTYYSVQDVIKQLGEIQELEGIDCFVLRQFDIDGLPFLIHLETNVTDDCNLSCKGCTHFSNLFDKKCCYALEDFKRDIAKIAENCAVIKLHLLGGEPLLNENLYKYVDFARVALPYTQIFIDTNGLLLFKHSEKLYESMKRNNVEFRISLYEPTLRIKAKIVDFLNSRNIKFTFKPEQAQITKFTKILSESFDSDPEKSMTVCTSAGCRFLRNGTIYKCPVEGLVYAYYDKFGITNDLKYGIEIDSIDNWHKVIWQLNEHPVEACRVCSETPELMDWELSIHPDRKDWVAISDRNGELFNG